VILDRFVERRGEAGPAALTCEAAVLVGATVLVGAAVLAGTLVDGSVGVSVVGGAATGADGAKR
jgi:hypothetical protein